MHTTAIARIRSLLRVCGDVRQNLEDENSHNLHIDNNCFIFL